jgi:hypothetical protein
VRIDHQIDEEMILRDDVSDEAVEAAAFVALGGFPTLMNATYCFACPADPLFSPAHFSFDPPKGLPSADKR